MFKAVRGKLATFKPSKTKAREEGGGAGSDSTPSQRRRATLHAGDLKKSCEVPDGEALPEWITANAVDFFSQCNLLYSSVAAYCTSESCPTMTAGPGFEYLWQGQEHPKPTAVPAQRYVELLFAWIQGAFDNQAVFPLVFGKGDPPKEWMSTVKKIFKRLLRVYAHLYKHHMDKIDQLGLLAWLNSGFKHFIVFTAEFKLIDDKKEYAPLQSLVNEIFAQYGIKQEK